MEKMLMFDDNGINVYERTASLVRMTRSHVTHDQLWNAADSADRLSRLPIDVQLLLANLCGRVHAIQLVAAGQSFETARVFLFGYST
jgi:hypothetical protein